nr:histone deacetylase [Deinococcus maricopensis]
MTPHPYRAYTPFRQLTGAAEQPRRQFMPRETYLDMLAAAEALLPLLDAPELDWADARRVHDAAYLTRWRRGDVTRDEERQMGFRWSPDIITRGLLSSGATLAATHDARRTGWGVNFGGGTHHAYRDHAEGFSFLNDVVISAARALADGWATRVLILDLDVHQGNGTAAMLAGEPRAFTLSVHAERNYPFRKERSTLDLALPDGTDDAAYLRVLHEAALPAAAAFTPDLLFYLAGADVLAGDQLGRLALSEAGLYARDHAVFTWARGLGVPLVTVMAGGYNHDAALNARARLGTLRAGLSVYAP